MLLTAVMAIAIALPSCGGAKKSDSSKSKPATVEESAPQADKEECSCGHCHASDAITVKAQEFVARTIIIMNNKDRDGAEALAADIKSYISTLSEAELKQFQAASQAAMEQHNHK